MNRHIAAAFINTESLDNELLSKHLLKIFDFASRDILLCKLFNKLSINHLFGGEYNLKYIQCNGQFDFLQYASNIQTSKIITKLMELVTEEYIQ